MLLFLLSSLSALGMAVSLPKIIVRVEKNVISQCDDLKQSRETTPPMYPLAAIVLFNIATVFYWFNPEQGYLSQVLFLLSVLSYIDIVRRWVPDCLIFLLSVYSVYCVSSGRIGSSPEEALMATGLFVFPLMVINGFSWLKKKVWVFASGDIYIALSIGLWLDKTTAVMVAGVSVLLALLYGSVCRQPHLPFIPFLLFSFLMDCFI
ncbi:prepilin peptidase [Candidatus Williamhamiltonella defendens]|uniref:prepilin peptidase n=1 Tax=Candidatus Williamhamiltonella defendens TaxID=138072 RepID=UPI0007403E83|nr:prepilin peptidase [Candidatus Hamiltonella defensa]